MFLIDPLMVDWVLGAVDGSDVALMVADDLPDKFEPGLNEPPGFCKESDLARLGALLAVFAVLDVVGFCWSAIVGLLAANF